MSDLPLVDIAYRYIRQKLLNGDYLPGTLLSENELATELNMSRTPIRDAMAVLSREGFVETLKKRGILVKGINIKEMYDMFDFMTALYVYVLDTVEPQQYEEVLPTMKQYLDNLVAASEQKLYREYYENGLMFVRTLLTTAHNHCFLQTFDMYMDKIVYFVVLYRAVNAPSRPYTSKKLYLEVYRHLSEGNISDAKQAFVESTRNNREELVRFM
ncbi:DNA-binding transcriptional regulator, GntR family [Paenibacillus sp. UNC496MF]|uniref:GntR family transcriptional regulator n=1 Tax=Paenibacillus sp. UNC496MF TaxID=1502753 RepID=UPI0008F30AA8|nr:GntR family transcriptional regulator [Paenibacillus sp. UNC496MF]SFJ58570.1 DNA-binding transcriptional regulator, GntR family [Paenibacillus sp. UNC496MF]